MLTIAAFVFAIVVLVAIHEGGHFAMARLCGVKVLAFSIGFGPCLWQRTSQRSGTHYALRLVPLGGYVKLLDQREGPVDSSAVAQAFDQQPLRSKVAITLAGPLANALLAVLLYAVLQWVGMALPQARLSQPEPQSLAAQAGLSGGEWVVQAGLQAQAMTDVASFEDLRWWLTKAALGGQDVYLRYHVDGSTALHDAVLHTSSLRVDMADQTMYRAIGISQPYAQAQLGDISPGGAAQQAGLRAGDVVLEVDAQPIRDAAQLRALIRASGVPPPPRVQQWYIERAGQRLTIPVHPRMESVQGVATARIGAMVGAAPMAVWVRSGLIEGLQKAFMQAWDVSAITLRMLWKMLTGSISVKNLSGPVTIADYAGQSAAMGWMQFVNFLAVLSVSLAVMNLLPIPALDGGHLIYYFWQACTGRPVSDRWMERLQRFGWSLLLLLMAVSLFNDMTHLLP